MLWDSQIQQDRQMQKTIFPGRKMAAVSGVLRICGKLQGLKCGPVQVSGRTPVLHLLTIIMPVSVWRGIAK